MKRLFTKSISLAFLCMLLTVLMIFSGCNSGSTATNFFESIQELDGVKKFDFEVDIETELNLQKTNVEINGTYNNENSMMATVTMTSGGVTIDFCDIVLDGDRVYLNISELLSTLGGDDVLGGKDYIYLDLKELASLAAITGTEMPNLSDLSAYTEARKTLTDKLYEILQKACEGVDPAILGKDGNKFTFTINEENIAGYISNIVGILVDEQDWIVSTLPELLEEAGLSDIADLIYDNESDIIDALESAKKDEKKDTENSLIDNEDFEISAYSELKTDGGRVWNMGMYFSMNSSDLFGNLDNVFISSNSIVCSVDTVITENAGDKEITKVDEDNAISIMDYVATVESKYDDMYSDTFNQNMNIENGYYTIEPEDFPDMNLEDSDYYINIKSMGIGEICLSGTTSELIFTDKEMLIDGELVEYTYVADTITITYDGTPMSFVYNENFAP